MLFLTIYVHSIDILKFSRFAILYYILVVLVSTPFLNLNVSLFLNRYNFIYIIDRKTRFSLKMLWGQPLRSQAAILNFTIPPY